MTRQGNNFSSALKKNRKKSIILNLKFKKQCTFGVRLQDD